MSSGDLETTSSAPVLSEAAAAPVLEGLQEQLPEWQVDHVYAWDDTAQQIVPSDPRVVEQLQRQGHFILGLTNAFRTKLGLLQNSVNGPLLAKRDQLVHHQAKLQARIDEVNTASGTIEQETRIACDEILERLRSTQRFKTSLLLRDKEDLAQDIANIQNLIEEVADRGKAHSMIDFLGKEKHLKDRCELFINKPFKQSIDVSADDFEHEARAYKDVVKKYRSLQELIEVKDTIISQLLEDRALLQKKVETMDEHHRKVKDALQEENKKLNKSLQDGQRDVKSETDTAGPKPTHQVEEEIDHTDNGDGDGDGDDDGGVGTKEEKVEEVPEQTGECKRSSSGGDGAPIAEGDSSSKGAWLMTIEHNGKKIEVYQEDLQKENEVEALEEKEIEKDAGDKGT